MSLYFEEKHQDVAEFKEACAENVKRLSKHGAHTFWVCTDGSDQSHMAFTSTLSLRKKHDHVAVFHAFKASAVDSLPAKFRPDRLKEEYSVELIGNLSADKHSLIWEDRSNRPVMETLNHSLYKFSKETGKLPDFVVMGGHGRKGPKEMPESLGSNTDTALRNLHLPCIIIKQPVVSRPRHFIMAVNDTELSRRGLDILLRLTNSRDKVTCVHFISPDDDDKDLTDMKSYYESELEEYGPINSKFQVVTKERGEAITHTISNYVNNSDCDFFAIAPRAKHRLSNISGHVVNHVKCNIILVKN